MEEGNKRYAVLAGCNYPGIPNYLDGAVNDVLKMRMLLISRFGFKTENIVLLVDTDLPEAYVTDMDVPGSPVAPDIDVPIISSLGQTDKLNVWDFDSPEQFTDIAVPGPPKKPTGKNIKFSLHEMIRRAKAGDVLFFHFSGHGVKIPSEHETEKTAIVPCDYNLITDVHMRQFLNRVPEGASFTYLSDSCTTGGDLIDKASDVIDRAEEQVDGPAVICATPPLVPNANHRVRMIPYATVFDHLASKSNIRSLNINDHLVKIFGNESSRWGTAQSDPFAESLPLDSGILLAGSQTDGASVDSHATEEFGEAHGKFCYAVRNVLQEHPNRISNKDLIIRTREFLGGMQIPCLYCSETNANAPFLWQPEQQQDNSE